ncbi:MULTISPECIES: hypothetical protein [Paracoccaceae]|uniref:Uncharacterized protein n=1 Tax=Marinibacterium profundimaris TaxID=1679460 RepID=A0A225NDK8_9RHOB|nr:hypothetical protein [Marinibacterium profundimaris]OWU69993.1 hypothetical protein ATO3_21200 [Marinibacterium profundimaris]
MSDLLTFDISVGPGPIAQRLDIDWEFSISNELTFNEPGENGFADGGFSNESNVTFQSSSIARDILVSDSMAFAFEKRGGLFKGEDGASFFVANENVDHYDSWRGTTIDAESTRFAGFDGEDRDAFFDRAIVLETEVLDRDFQPGFSFDFELI